MGAAVSIYRPRNTRLQPGQDRYLKVLIDQKERGEVWIKQVRTFDVAPGPHKVQLKSWLLRSRALSFEVGVGETVAFACPRFWSSVGWPSLRPATEKDLAGMAELRTDPPKPRNLGEQLRNDPEQL